MKTRSKYYKPEIEVIKIDMESPLMQTSVTRDNTTPHTGAAGSKQRNFWME